MSFPAHGVLIDVTADKLVLHRTLLATSLGAPATQDIPLESIDTVRVSEPTATGFGALDRTDVCCKICSVSIKKMKETIVQIYRTWGNSFLIGCTSC